MDTDPLPVGHYLISLGNSESTYKRPELAMAVIRPLYVPSLRVLVIHQHTIGLFIMYDSESESYSSHEDCTYAIFRIVSYRYSV